MIEHLFRSFGAALSGDVVGAAHRRKGLGEQEVAGEARPIALAGTDHHVHAFAVQVHHVGRDIEAHSVFRMKQLKTAETWCEPVAGDGLHG